MLKIVVFDSGWGGELFADYVEEEIPVVEVIREIDWRNAPYCEKSEEEVLALTEKALQKYIGRVDVIVIASYLMTAVAIDYLRQKYPQQKFMGFRMNIDCKNGSRIVLLAPKLLSQTHKFEEMMARNPGVTIYTANCLD